MHIDITADHDCSSFEIITHSLFGDWHTVSLPVINQRTNLNLCNWYCFVRHNQILAPILAPLFPLFCFFISLSYWLPVLLYLFPLLCNNHVIIPSFHPLWWSCWWLFCIYFCWPSHYDGSFVSCTSSWRKTLFSLQTAWRHSFANLFLLSVFESLASFLCIIDYDDRPCSCIITNKINMFQSLNCCCLWSYII